MKPAHDRPLAAHGLLSYRYRGRYGWVMIGATDHDSALREAARSIAPAVPSIDQLQFWNGWNYVAVQR